MKNIPKILLFDLAILGLLLAFMGGCKKTNDNNNPNPKPTVPVIVTETVVKIAQTTANSGGNVTSDGGATVTARGVCWGISANPTIAGVHTFDGSGKGIFSSVIKGLNPSTIYYVRAYATNNVGTAYGNQVSFTTIKPLYVFTNIISNITQVTATCGGIVNSDGGSTVTARGVCWNTSPSPTTIESHTTDGDGTGNFASSLTGLTGATLYYVRAYVTNSESTLYGNERSFHTSPLLPTLTTATVTDILLTSATSGGTISSDGGGTVTARGVCWSTSHDPTISDAHSTDNIGTGVFVSSLIGLSAGTLYYVRAYATNIAGTAYGNKLSFTTLNLPTIETVAVTDIIPFTAKSGGIATSDGGAAVTARGVCWGTSSNPTIANSSTIDGQGLGTFSSSVIDLYPNIQYYLRAYATNIAGTGYGNEVSFMSSDGIFTIGQQYGGGKIFYIDASGKHGLIAHSDNQNWAIWREWGCDGILVGGTSTDIGTGQANTTIIVNGCGAASNAARVCNDLVSNGYTDWYLPSVDELFQMMLHKYSIDDRWGDTYWSSSEDNYYYSYVVRSANATTSFVRKNDERMVRAIRSF